METQYYRTFIGLPVSVGHTVFKVREHLMDVFADERISWVNPENFHVTLRFLGDTSVTAIHQINEALQEELLLPGKLSLQLNGPQSFGPRKKPRVIWLGFDQDGPIRLLKTGTDRALEKCGWPESEQPFRAHLTLGRVRSLNNSVRYYEILEEIKMTFSGSAKVDRLVYYRSELGDKGPRYTVLKELNFQDQAF